MQVYNFLVLLFYLSEYVVAEDIEYYPSQSIIRKTVKINYKYKNKSGELIYQNRHFNNQHNLTYNIKNKSRNKNFRNKRAIDPVFHGYPKTREELWNDRFLNLNDAFDQTPSLIKLIHNITLTYLSGCTPVILYDSQVKSKQSYLFQNLPKNFPVTFIHGFINDDNELAQPKLRVKARECIHYIVFLTDLKLSAKILGKQSESKVVIIARSSQWAVREFLYGPHSRVFINLLVIGHSFKDGDDNTLEVPYIMYTHKLYTDGLGASKPVVLNSWSHGKFSRNINLFPPKMIEGYAGHRFVVAAANQPPFVFKRIQSDRDGGNPRTVWDGVEVRLLNLLAERNNFSIEFVEPREVHLGPGDAVSKEVTSGRADIGIAGVYLTSERTQSMDVSFSHSQDCAVFITVMSTALPRYRAILGPFHWHVWVALTFTYLFGIFPLAFSDKHTLRHLLHNSGEIENMFWYVFGTFTNCFTFVGKNSWSKTNKITTRLLIGWYWLFTIIITSCYTGSIIAFVTLPIFPETVDSIDQLLKGFYRIITLDYDNFNFNGKLKHINITFTNQRRLLKDKGGWERWFFNSSDPKTNRLLNKMEFAPDVASGIRNTTKAFFWSYAFLGSEAELKYIVQANFSDTKSKRAMLHISNECFVPFGVSMVFPYNSLYTTKLNGDVQRVQQGGIIDKLFDEVRWDIQRSTSGRLLSAVKGSLKIISAEEKGLTLDDTQGMFLLLSAGFLIAAASLISEWMGGCSRKCKRQKSKDTTLSASSNENLIAIPNNIDVIDCDAESELDFDYKPSSATSRDTLDGEIINVTQESISVHDNINVENWDSRRSSSVDLDREVRNIFENDENKMIQDDDEDINDSEHKF